MIGDLLVMLIYESEGRSWCYMMATPHLTAIFSVSAECSTRIELLSIAEQISILGA